MHHAQILQYMHRQPAQAFKVADLKHKADLDRYAEDPEYPIEEVIEEIDYLLMAGWIVGNTDGYHLSNAWDELDESAQDIWRGHSAGYRDRPELDNPIKIQRTVKTVWEWEQRNWHSFKFCVIRSDEDERTEVAIVSGLSQGMSYPIATAKAAIDRSLSAWYLTEAGRADWYESVEDFNIGDLANSIDRSARDCTGLIELLKANGIRSLKIEDSFSGADYWSYDDILGTPPSAPPACPIGSLRIYWTQNASGEIFYYPVDSLLLAAAQLEMLSRYDNFLLDSYRSNGGVQRLVELNVNNILGSGWRDCTDEIAPF